MDEGQTLDKCFENMGWKRLASTGEIWRSLRKRWQLSWTLKDVEDGQLAIWTVAQYRKLEKGMTENKMVGWHHRPNGHEFEQVPGDGEG